MENKRNHKQIYITVVTSSLTILANKVARRLKPNEDIFDACSKLANEVAKENGLSWSNVLVQYYNHYSDEYPAMNFKVPVKPNQKQFKEFSSLHFEKYLDKFNNDSYMAMIGCIAKRLSKQEIATCMTGFKNLFEQFE
jgi:hypothetical protein